MLNNNTPATVSEALLLGSVILKYFMTACKSCILKTHSKRFDIFLAIFVKYAESFTVFDIVEKGRILYYKNNDRIV